MKRGARSGFTLPEVLVTIAIVATLAAVLLPALNSQLTKGEASRASNDLLAVQTAINTFVSDVRRYPRSLNQLTTGITTPGALDIKGLVYPAPLVARWKGPYLAKELTASSTLITGFGAEVQSAFAQASYNGINYVQVIALPIPIEDFTSLDQIIDDVANSSSGQLRYVSASSSATFYAVPIQ
ncbi:MAG: prepilin-type N-terminal cleavage/methylation domain-containing protein [Gemmatimonadaceae bacterium]|nr:prepilin-type N-terminal cleavage/methylation domain-containing protein [Gemmatimonadaceae bacterium]